jgi:hypothetical protein
VKGPRLGLESGSKMIAAASSGEGRSMLHRSLHMLRNLRGVSESMGRA